MYVGMYTTQEVLHRSSSKEFQVKKIQGATPLIFKTMFWK